MIITPLMEENAKKYSFFASCIDVVVKIAPIVEPNTREVEYKWLKTVRYDTIKMQTVLDSVLKEIIFNKEKDGFDCIYENKEKERKVIFIEFEYRLIENTIKVLELINKD